MIFQTTAIVSKFMSMRDNSFRIQVDTQELRPEEIAVLSSFLGRFVTVGFAGEETELKLEAPVASLNDGKSHSTRLRNVLYVLWQTNNKNLDFDTYYASTIESIITLVKSKLPS